VYARGERRSPVRHLSVWLQTASDLWVRPNIPAPVLDTIVRNEYGVRIQRTPYSRVAFT